MIALAAGWLAIAVTTAIGTVSLQRAPVEPDADLPDLDHVACCTDDTKSLCGLDVSGWPWGPPGGHADCVVCLDLSGRSAPCPITGKACP